MPANPNAKALTVNLPQEATSESATPPQSTTADKHRILFEQMAQGAFFQNADGSLVDVNQSALNLFGITREQFLGRTSMDPAWRIIRDDGSDMAGSEHPSMLALISGKPILDAVAGVFNPQKKDFVWLSVNAIPLFHPGETRPYQVVVTLHDITQMKHAEGALRDISAKLARAQQMARIGNWEWNPNTGDIALSIEIYHILGLPLRAPLDNTFPESIMHAEDRPIWHSGIREALRRGDQFAIDFRGIRPDGTEVWIHCEAAIERDADGRAARMYGTGQDITDRVLREGALRESEEKFRLLSENTMDAIWLLDLDLVFKYVNPAIERMLGFAPDEWVDSRLPDRTSPEQMTAMGDIIAKAWGELPVNDGVLFETEFHHKHGHAVPVEIHSTFLLDKDQQPVGLQGVTRDISDRRRAEAKRHAAHQGFLAVLDGIEATIYVADLNTHEILFMNRHMRETFGGDFTGQLCHLVFRGESSPCGMCTNDQILDANGDPLGVCTWEDQNPITGLWYINCDRAIEWVDGRTVRLQVATDITRLKTLEEERIKYESRLNQSQKMEAIGTLAGGIAHDFNNILSSVIGFTELAMMKASEDAELTDYLNEVLNSGRRARDLVKQILTFSRQQHQEVKPIELDPLVNETIRMLRATIPTTIDIKANSPNTPVTIEGDPTQIHQVLLNLATNAAHAMESDGGVLTVTIGTMTVDKEDAKSQPGLRPEPYAQLTVQDTGHGISEKHLSTIFDPYFTTKGPDRGSGLGLSVAHGIVKAHRGHIQITSTVGVGTIVHVFLPLIQESTTAEPMRTTDSLPGGNEHILVVDDEPNIARILKETLERFGYTAEVATGGPEALARFENAPDRFDAVITDTTMPQLTGDQLCQSIKAIRADIPVVLTTGFSERITPETMTKYDVDGLLFKPVDRDDLAQTLRRAIDRRTPKAT